MLQPVTEALECGNIFVFLASFVLSMKCSCVFALFLKGSVLLNQLFLSSNVVKYGLR